MRGGKFLAEESPENLITQYQCDTLEDVFLKLAVLQNKGKRRRSSIAQEISDQIAMPAAMTVSLGFFLSLSFSNFEHFIFNSISCDDNKRVKTYHNIKIPALFHFCVQPIKFNYYFDVYCL